MGIITTEELAVALGVDPEDWTPAQEAQYQFYIDTISAYVETYTGVTFTFHEDEVVRQQADYYGVIELAPTPVLNVSAVTAVAAPNYYTAYGFDGLGSVYGVAAHGVYDVTMSYGYATPPQDIKSYVTESVRGVIANPTGLASFRVGDVTEAYGGKGDSGGVTTYAGLGQAVLDSYRSTEATWRLGTHQFAPSPQLPIL